MRVLVVENYVETPAGLVGRALAEVGAEVALCRAHLGEPLPSGPDGFDGLLVLGGEQTALDDDLSPWLPKLVSLIRNAGEAGKAVLGICLGAQLVARAYGGTNLLGLPVEFGWHEVRPTAAGEDDPIVSALGAAAPLFHWHTDTFTLPAGAAHLASSAMTDIQAFRVGRAVYGIQFHFEADRPLVERWSERFAGTIAAYAPDWPKQRPRDAASKGATADAIGLDLARRWVRLIEPSSDRAGRARIAARQSQEFST